MEGVFKNCVVQSPFADPPVSEASLVEEMLCRITALDARCTAAGTAPSVEVERHPKQLAYLLKRTNHHLEGAMSEWQEWVEFRRKSKADSITAETVQELISAGLAEWKGADKEGRPCLIITGRKMTKEVPRSPTLFRQFIIYLAEEGLKKVLTQPLVSEENIDRNSAGPAAANDDGRVVIIYDRRGLLFENIDINLHRDCQAVLHEMRRFYSDRVHCFHIVYMTWGHWIAYYLLLKPLLGLSGSANKFLATETEDGLLPYFPSEQLRHLQPFYSGTTRTYTFEDGVLKSEVSSNNEPPAPPSAAPIQR